MKLHCSRIFFSSNPNIQSSIVNRYYNVVLKHLGDLIPSNNEQGFLREVTHQQFCQSILSEKDSVGIYLGGSGVKQCVQLNQVKGIRAALVHIQYIAEMCRKHNNANVCLIGHQCIGQELCGFLVKKYLLAEFDNEERNMLRIDKLSQLQDKYHIQQ